MNLTGKKLLILGANIETAAIVETAKKMGVSTYVTDNNPNAPAKKIADKAYNVDGFDVPGLITLAKEKQVDGVLVGVADSLIEKYQHVCEALKLPCYATSEQVMYFTNKYYFKQKCAEYGIFGVPEYNLDKGIPENAFPIVIKPADANSGNGISIVESPNDLLVAIEKALSCSRMKKVLAEKYMGNAVDVSIYYTFQNGEYYLSSISDRYTSGEQGRLTRICLGDIFPSQLAETFLAEEHPRFLKMFSDLKCKNGVLYISAFYENGRFYVYDPGFRLQGGGFHLIVNAASGFDHREMLIHFALTGKFGDENVGLKSDPYLHGKSAAVIWFLLKSGTINKIDGLDYIKSHPDVVHIVQRFKIGDTVKPEDVGTERQVFARVYIVSKSKKALEGAILGIKENLSVTGIDANNLLLLTLDLGKAFNQKMLGGKTIVIAGGTKGVGRELAIACAEHGANVIAAGRDESSGNAVVQKIHSIGGKSDFIKTDLRDVAQIKALFAKTNAIYGKIHGFVAYAGVTPVASLTECDEETYDHVMDVNDKAAFFAAQCAINEMVKTGGGSIVFTGSAHAWSGQKDRAAYAMSKGALITLMEHIAHNYAEDNIRCNMITLGWTPTDGELALRASQGISEQELIETAEKILPMGKMLGLNDPIPAFLYYLSDQSALVTGSNIRVTAGEYIG